MKRKLGLLALGLIAPAGDDGLRQLRRQQRSGAGDAGSGTGEVTYWLWDSNQLPAYQKCADAFQTANPDVTVKIEQLGWNDYWTKLTTGFVSGTAPDVFTDHLQKYPEFASQGQLVPLDDLIKQDNVDLTDSTRRGWPKSGRATTASSTACPRTSTPSASSTTRTWPTAAGVTQEQLDTMEWNPTDGGTYEETIAKLTIDNNGVHGDEPGFDKTQRQDLRPRPGRRRVRSGPDRVQHVHRQQRAGRPPMKLWATSTTTTTRSSRRPSPGGSR